MKTAGWLATAEKDDFAALIGLDWADKKHVWALLPAGGRSIEHGEIESSPEAVDGWIAQLTTRFGSGRIAIALEQSRGAVVALLSKYSSVVLFAVHPKSAADYRKTFYPSGGKGDPVDSELLLELLSVHRDRLRPLQPDTVDTRMLRVLTESRRQLVGRQTACSNQLTATLKVIFPQAVDWLDKLHTPMACDFLRRWPTLQQLPRARPQTVRNFFQQHNSRSVERIDERLEQMATAMPATSDPALLEPSCLMIQYLTTELDHLREAIASFDAKIAEVAPRHPDYEVVRSFPGAGPVMAPRLLALLGTLRDRFASALELQCFSGIAPVTKASGKQRCVQWRYACSKFDRQTAHEWALHSRKKCQWAQQYYESLRAKGKGHHAAIRALAYKWLRILYRCWKDHLPYDEARWLNSRREHQPKPQLISTTAVDIQWKSCGSFSRPTRIRT